MSPADLLTCWGPGPINVRRAPAASLRLVLGDGLMRTDLDRLIEARDRTFEPAGDGGAGTASATLAGDRVTLAAELKRARALLTAARLRAAAGSAPTGAEPSLVDGSACYSVWIVARDGRRTWYSFTVLDAADPALPRRAVLTW